MATSKWHKLSTVSVAAPPKTLFGLVADMPSYGRWLPRSNQFAETTDVEPYPVQLGSRYHDGKPQEPGKDWWGTVTGFQPPGSLDFRHMIQVRQLRATVDVHIHYSFEPDCGVTRVARWLVLEIRMPLLFRPLRRAIIAAFDKENVRTMAALKAYAEAQGKATGPAAVAAALSAHSAPKLGADVTVESVISSCLYEDPEQASHRRHVRTDRRLCRVLGSIRAALVLQVIPARRS